MNPVVWFCEILPLISAAFIMSLIRFVPGSAIDECGPHGNVSRYYDDGEAE